MRSKLTSGAQCTRCLAGRYKTVGVYDTIGWHVRYLICSKCGTRAQQAMAADEVNRRQKRSVKRMGSGRHVDNA